MNLRQVFPAFSLPLVTSTGTVCFSASLQAALIFIPIISGSLYLPLRHRTLRKVPLLPALCEHVSSTVGQQVLAMEPDRVPAPFSWGRHTSGNYMISPT
jgi:hypothetical protein